MEKDIVGGDLGTVGKYDVALHGAQVAVTIDVGVPYGSVGVVAKVELEAILKLVAEKIPGQIDDAFIALVISALKA